MEKFQLHQTVTLDEARYPMTVASVAIDVGLDAETLRAHLSDYKWVVRGHAGSHVDDPSAREDFFNQLGRGAEAEKVKKAIDLLYFGN